MLPDGSGRPCRRSATVAADHPPRCPEELTRVPAAARRRGLVAALGRVLNRDSYPVLTLVDGGRAVALEVTLLDEQFPPRRS